MGSNAAILSKGKRLFSMCAVRSSTKKKKKKPIICLGTHWLGRCCGKKNSPEHPRQHSLALGPERDVSSPQHWLKQLGETAGAEKPCAPKISLFKKKKWKNPLCQPCIVFWLRGSCGCAEGMDFCSWREQKSAPHLLEKSRNGSRRQIYLFCVCVTRPMTVFAA